MLDSLKALSTPRGPNTHWKVENNKIQQVSGPNHRLSNLVDLIKSINFTSTALASSDAKSMTAEETQRLFTPLVSTSLKMQLAIENQPLFKRIFISVVQFLFTGTTLSRALDQLKNTAVESKGIPNTLSAQIAYPKLVSDAEFALKSSDNYQQIAQKYTLPMDRNKSMMSAIHNLQNPIIYHLKQTMTHEWQQMRLLLKEGKTLQDAAVMDHADKAMQLGDLLVNLSINQELPMVLKKLKPDAIISKASLAEQLGSQLTYPYWAVTVVSQLYKSLRSYPTFTNGSWHSSFATAKPFMTQFYQAGTRPALWNASFNNICALVKDSVDVGTLFQVDSRFYLEPDTIEQLDANHEFLNDDYFDTQLITKKW